MTTSVRFRDSETQTMSQVERSGAARSSSIMELASTTFWFCVMDQAPLIHRHSWIGYVGASLENVDDWSSVGPGNGLNMLDASVGSRQRQGEYASSRSEPRFARRVSACKANMSGRAVARLCDPRLQIGLRA